MDDRDARLARAAYQLGMATAEQVQTCTAIAERTQPSRPIGQVFVEERVLTLDQVFALLRAMDAEPVAKSSSLLRAAAGQKFARYHLIEEIGRGAMGTVFKARDEELGRVVAIKLLSDTHAENLSVLKRFQREAQTASKLRHPALVAIHDVGTHAGTHYFTMDYVEGTSLERLIETDRLTVAQIAQILEEVARAVDHAHGLGVVHRDLKPANIVVDAEHKPFVLDFGLARSMADESRMTRTGQSLGTPLYMSPEQVNGDPRRIGPRCDVYSLGVILYQALTGRPPFAGASVMEIYQRILTTSPVAPRVLRSRVPRDLEMVCLKAMERRAEDRYATARELADDLARFRRGEPVFASPVPRARRALRALHRRLVPVLLAAASACALVAILLLARRPPMDAGGYRQRAEARRGQGDLRGALDDCSTALSFDGEHGPTWLARAAVNRELGDVAAERADLDRAIELMRAVRAFDGPCFDAFLARARLHLAAGDVARAADDADGAVQRRPRDADALALRGVCRVRLDRVREGADDLALALQLRPDAPEEMRTAWRDATARLPVEETYAFDGATMSTREGVSAEAECVEANRQPTAAPSAVFLVAKRSRLVLRFRCPVVPTLATVDIDHLSSTVEEARLRGNSAIRIRINDETLVDRLDVGEHVFRTDRLSVTKYLRAGENAVEVFFMEGESRYWLRSLTVRCTYPPGTKLR